MTGAMRVDKLTRGYVNAIPIHPSAPLGGLRGFLTSRDIHQRCRVRNCCGRSVGTHPSKIRMKANAMERSVMRCFRS